MEEVYEKSTEIKIEERKEKIKNWLKDPYHLTFLGIMLFTIGIRFYYFWLTKNQPLWWDEADYMAYAKNLAGYNTYWVVTGQHSSLFPFFAAFFFKLGFSEEIIKFFICFLPSVILIFLVYLICINFYNDKRIALISMFLISVFWELLFNGLRFHVEGISLMFGFLSIYIFWKGYEKKEKIFGLINANWAIPLTIFFILLTYASRRGYFVFGLFFLCYILFTRKLKDLFNDKYNWIALGLAIPLFVIIDFILFKHPITQISQQYYSSQPFSLLPLQIFGSYFYNIFNQNLSILFYLFWIGFFLLVFNIVLSIGFFKKIQNSEMKSDLFIFLMIVIVLSYFLFYQRRPAGDFGEPRWYYPLLLSSTICISKSSLFLSDFIKKYNRPIATIILILFILYGGYYELKHGDMIIKDKLNSFKGIKEASLYIKAISNESDIIVCVASTQPSYYAERLTMDLGSLVNSSTSSNVPFERFLEELEKNKNIKYLIITFSEPNHPKWMRDETYYINPQTGQTLYSTWQIPFLNMTIDFINKKQQIQEEISYGNLTFKFLINHYDAFTYEIKRIN